VLCCDCVSCLICCVVNNNFWAQDHVWSILALLWLPTGWLLSTAFCCPHERGSRKCRWIQNTASIIAPIELLSLVVPTRSGFDPVNLYLFWRLLGENAQNIHMTSLQTMSLFACRLWILWSSNTSTVGRGLRTVREFDPHYLDKTCAHSIHIQTPPVDLTNSFSLLSRSHVKLARCVGHVWSAFRDSTGLKLCQ
jgi:nitric oxide reductase large subunit